MSMRKIDRGKIWMVELTTTPSDIVGHEQGYTRPCLIIVDNPKLELTTTIPLTGNLDSIKFPHTHLIKKSRKNGLDADSVALIFQIRSLSYNRFVSYKGELEYTDLNKILYLIKDYLKV